MSAPEASAPATEVVEQPPVETSASVETPAPEVAVEAAILTKDPQVVEANLANAGPVSTEVVAETPAPTEVAAAPVEEGAPVPETPHKEGSTLLNFLKKHIPNPKGGVDKKAPGLAGAGKSVVPELPKAEGEVVPVSTSEPTVVEPTEEQPFEGGDVQFKTHGGIFGGGYKSRTLIFGKEQGYSHNALTLYFAAHKAASYIGSSERTTAAYENAAHANVTGTGLLFIVKAKALDIPLSIINLADVTGVTTNYGHFTIKTSKSGEYEFNATSVANAKQWKAEIEKRADQSKAVLPGIHEREEYKTAFASYQDRKGKATEPVTSDEEGEGRPLHWTRRISGSFHRVINPSKEKEVPAVKEPIAAEGTTDEAPATDAAAATDAAVAETSAETTAAPEKKDKRKSLGFKTPAIFKSKPSHSKEPSPEPVAATEETPAETVVTETTGESAPPASESTPATEETTTAPAPTEKSKRQSIFSGLFPTKDKTVHTSTNGESTEPAAEVEPVATTSEPIPEETTAIEETKPVSSPKTKGNSLTRRLSSQIKSFGRSKSPEKSSKSAKVSDEAPKITTAIGSTPETAPVEKTEEETPVSTTEAPSTSVETPSEPPAAPVVTTQA